MSRRNKARHRAVLDALAELKNQVSIETTEKNIRWGILSQAVMDLVPNATPMEGGDYPPDLYLQGKEFEEDASWLGLDPEWVRNVLERHGLLVGGRRRPMDLEGRAA